jgi:hypothetical protein
VRRVDGDDLAGDEPVEQHADRGEVLLDSQITPYTEVCADIAAGLVPKGPRPVSLG